MKKVITLSLICASIAVACNKKAHPSVTKTEPASPPVAAPVTQTINPTSPEAPGVKPEDAALIAEGKTVYEAKCGKCHALKVVDVYTTQRWEGILRMMIPKAKLTEDEAKQVTAYVNANAKKM
jgi:mono/diheme cytochrome c family protein